MKKVALLFSGQGSQYIGMGKALYNQFPEARNIFDRANEALGFDIAGLCFEGDIDTLTRTENAQPALLTMSVAAFEVFRRETKVEPVFMAGHSLGEFSALTCAGVIPFEDAVRLVRKRGQFMEAAIPAGLGAMAAIRGIDKEEIEEACKNSSNASQLAVVSNYNAPDQIVISGHAGAIKEAGQRLEASGAEVIPLKVSTPFHSPLMAPAADLLREELGKYSYNEFKYAVISNVTALPYENTGMLVEYLAKQVLMPVRWYETMLHLEAQGVEIAVELGPQAVLKNLAGKCTKGIGAFSYDKEEDRVHLYKALLTGTDRDEPRENMKLKLIYRSMAIAVCTKNSNWDNEAYRAGVIEPYKRIQAMYEELQKQDTEPSVQQMREALEMLKSVFITKQTEPQEQKDRFNQIFEETGLGQLFEDMNLAG